ncbi:hypothetical protein K461DRAFT_293078 [Myriangium duriaei CBS 260.36]|uniref:Uncharacterized protein n=1 Tax=Myriangium duriaei CBS 260.36 TaxID=1168546 RepID=A0A9P4J5E3_9PEZI|nr:hypothetical protein K461DRAFT_293078 [Myriangium duriaei CBS 260.36]
MSAVIVKGIIISLSVVAAVGIALQSPDVREWLEEQRQKLVEVLRSMSETLDPQTRSQAEAFAYEGRLPTQQEMQGMTNATAVATGRDTNNDSAQRRLQRQSSGPSIDATERRRLGREYLARRNQELLDLKNKRQSDMSEKSAVQDAEITNDTEKSAAQTLEQAVSNGTFDELINPDGTLRLNEKDIPTDHDSLKSAVPEEPITQIPTMPSVLRTFRSGSHFGNPFGDEFAMPEDLEADGLQTPRPPVPPKISLDANVPGSFPPDPPITELPTTRASPIQQDAGEISYDEQLARALSLSLAESEEQARTTLRRRLTEDKEFAMAIEDSLKEAVRQNSSSRASEPSNRGPLVDFSADASQPLHTPQMTTNPWSVRSDDEDLYTLTPMPTGSKAPNNPAPRSEPPVPIRSANSSNDSSQYGSFHFSPSQTLSPIPAAALSLSSATLSPGLAATDAISTEFSSDSETESFASLPRSSTLSIDSLVEVEDVDIDSMSDDDGIRTPQSWSEVDSEVAESERSESEAEDMVRI